MIDNENKQYLLRKKEEIITNCPLCHGTKPYCKCAYDFRVEIHKASSNIPIAYRDFSLDQLTHPELQKQKVKIAEFLTKVGTKEQTDLLITGGPGLAKSAVACLILSQVLKQGKRAYYFPSLRAAIDACMKDFRAEVDASAYIPFKVADTIVIDGLGYGFIRERSNATDIVLDHLERRKILGKHVVFVSSVPVEELSGGEKTIIDLLSPTVINFKGFNYVKEVLEKADTNKATAAKKASTRSRKTINKAFLDENGNPLSPYEISLLESGQTKKGNTK
jgi:DNA replication protein DnaC